MHRLNLVVRVRRVWNRLRDWWRRPPRYPYPGDAHYREGTYHAPGEENLYHPGD